MGKIRVKGKKVVCLYCLKKCDEFCNGILFKPQAEIIANYPRGSQAKWGHGWNFTRKLIYYRDNGKCYYCKETISMMGCEVHHLKHRQFRGSDHPRNLILLCVKCHKITFAPYIEKIQIRQTMVKIRDEFWRKQGFIESKK